MVVTRYKPLFSVTASYELQGLGVLVDDLYILPLQDSVEKMNGLSLLSNAKKNSATVFYEGLEKPQPVPLTCEPLFLISSDEYFYFTIQLRNQKNIRGLKFHSTAAIAKEIGFPILYDAQIPALNAPTQLNAREDVKFMPPVFTFTVPLPLSGIVSEFAFLEIRNEKNILVKLPVPEAALNRKTVDGPGAIPEFSFTVDASSLETGIYEFKAGNYKKKYFISPGVELTGATGLIRVLKNNFLEYKKNLADPSFAKFILQIPKA
jgi:hypothetical protein